MGSESVPKNIVNNAIKLFLKAAIGSSAISNRNSFRVLFEKIAYVYFVWKIYLYFSIGNGQPGEPALCQLYRHTFVFHGRCVVGADVCLCRLLTLALLLLKVCSQHVNWTDLQQGDPVIRRVHWSRAPASRLSAYSCRLAATKPGRLVLG